MMLLHPSRPFPYTALFRSEFRDWAPTWTPEPLAAVSIDTWVAVPDVTVIVPESSVNDPSTAWIVAVHVAWPVKVADLVSPEGTRSPFATPPVLLVSDQVTGTLATKALDPSRSIA